MKYKLSNFRFKTWHFGLTFIILVILTSIIGKLLFYKIPSEIENSQFIEINNITFDEAVSSGISFVLFEKKESDLCSKMEYNINQLYEENKYQIKFYKLDIDKYPGEYSVYQIAGVPTVIVFKDGKETERIMGLVSTKNLKIIYKRITK